MTWKTEQVKNSFPKNVADAILKIPLSRRRMNDCWSWAYITNGYYTVKSGYKETRKSRNNLNERINHEDTNQMVEYKSLWKQIWSLPIPPKISFFRWHICKDILPTCDALRHRGLDIQDLCPCCKNETETMVHAIIQCNSIKDLWNSSGLPYVLEFDNNLSF